MPEESLNETDWMLNRLGETPGLPEAVPTLTFAGGGSLHGFTGCNQFRGTWERDGDSLALKIGPMTLKACAAEVSQQETAFLQALAATRTANLSDDRLEMFDESRRLIATLSKLTSAAIIGPIWRAVSYNNGSGAVVSVAGNVEITAEFAADGRLAGNAGCNRYMSTYTVVDNTLTVAQIATTRRACEPTLMDQERQFLAALERSESFRLGAQTLTLLAADGSTLVKFQST